MPRRSATISQGSDHKVIDIENGFTSEEFSDDEVPAVDTWQPPVLGPKPSHLEYENVSLSLIDPQKEVAPVTSILEALKSLNLKAESQRTEICNLKIEIADLCRSVPKEALGSNRKQKVQHEGPPEVTNFKGKIELHAKKFGVMSELFVPFEAFLVTKPLFDPQDKSCYKTSTGILNGVIAELYDQVPESLHKLMEDHSYF
jgi:hypothetical protein